MTPSAPVLPPQHPDVDTLLAALITCGNRPTRKLVAQLAAADFPVLVHGARVAELAVEIGRHLRIADERLVILCRAALLHDVGKRHMPRAVLDKPGPLGTDERRLLEEHPLVGEQVMRSAGLVAEATIVRHHHERWDGGGYVDHLSGPSIPLESRIISAADAFDAMTSERAYRAAGARYAALVEIDRAADSQLDPRCAAALCDVVG